MAEAARRAERLGFGLPETAQMLFAGVVKSEWAEEAGSKSETPGSLMWPVREGVFVRGFGSGSGGYHLAVDVAGPKGLPVRAAARGLIAYTGNRMRGYGNMVMMVHPGGWTTLYAHNHNIHLRPGQLVRAGDVIADVGNTGISRGPHVHFELIHRRRNCDPTPLFDRIHHGNGRYSAITNVFWRDADERPARIRCRARVQHPG
jgi:murein DD-endopeptidase MepM/ murein hydrolase activator NlpD